MKKWVTDIDNTVKQIDESFAIFEKANKYAFSKKDTLLIISKAIDVIESAWEKVEQMQALYKNQKNDDFHNFRGGMLDKMEVSCQKLHNIYSRTKLRIELGELPMS